MELEFAPAQHLLDHLREEAQQVKECFTTFVFQSATLAAIAVGFILNNIAAKPVIALAAAPVIVLLMIVCRIGVFKFTTANRNFGYQLHLARLRTFVDHASTEDERKRINDLMDVDWEVALRAWRVVQVAVFRTIYRTPRVDGWLGRISLGQYEPTTRASEVMQQYAERLEGKQLDTEGYPWWHPEHLTRLSQGSPTNNAKAYRWWHATRLSKRAVAAGPIRTRVESFYYTGTYLRDMLGGLHLMQWLLVATMAWPVLQGGAQNWKRVVGFGVLTLVVSTVVWLRQRRISRRREILENEALSIHSCAITWAYVVIVHTLSLNEEKSQPYLHYTQKLAHRCRNAANDAFDLPNLTRRYLETGNL